MLIKKTTTRISDQSMGDFIKNLRVIIGSAILLIIGIAFILLAGSIPVYLIWIACTTEKGWQVGAFFLILAAVASSISAIVIWFLKPAIDYISNQTKLIILLRKQYT